MSNRLNSSLLVLLSVSALCVGCLETDKSLHYLGDRELHYYRDAATEVDYPDVGESTPEEVRDTKSPRTLEARRHDEVWDLPLVEALQIALRNSEIIRAEGLLTAGAPGRTVSEQTSTVYDPAIQESGVLFGGRGVESALAAFDTQFTTRMIWGRDERIQNNIFFGGGLNPGSVFTNETGNFEAELQKQFAHGGLLRLTHNWDYSLNNSPAQLFPSSYTGSIGAEYRHPLWAGAGTDYTRIAGPITQRFGGITGVNQGVVIARINNDLTIAEFEESVRRLLFDVEKIYWDLYLSYRRYDTAVVARDSALRTWREAKARLEAGGVENFKPADEAQARDRYYETRAQVEAARSAIYANELKLRRILGLPVNDGRVIRPADEPSSARFEPDWQTSLAQALTERVELRKQKWQIKSLELQHQAAQSLTNPRLDFVSGYRVNGFGDQLFASDDDDGLTTQGLRSAYETITQGNQTGWNLGFELTMPLGFRQAHAQVRNIELRLAKARDLLGTLEQDVSHEVAFSLQKLTEKYRTARSHFNRLQAAARRVELFEAELEAGTVTADEVLRAQASLAEAENSYYTSLVEYNQELALFQFRKGTLLEHNNVQLAENAWTPEAYEEALRRAWARTHAFEAPKMNTEPQEFDLPAQLQPGVPEMPVPEHREAPEESPPSELPPTPAAEGTSTPSPPARFSDPPDAPVSGKTGTPLSDGAKDTAGTLPADRFASFPELNNN